MNIVYVLLPAALLLALIFVLLFLWAARHRQFDDLETPAHKMLLDKPPAKPKKEHATNNTDKS